MKPQLSPTVWLFALMISGAYAQLVPASLPTATSENALDPAGYSGFSLKNAAPGSLEIRTAPIDVTQEEKFLAVSDPATLKTQALGASGGETTAEVFSDLSPYRRILVSASAAVAPAKTVSKGLAEISAAYSAAEPGSTANCGKLQLSIAAQADQDRSKLLEIVEREISANPGCACEIVKAAITAADAEPATVVSIVETAIHANPETMRIVSQCAIAAAPDSISAVQELLAKLDPNAGDASYSSKGDAKSAKSAKGEIAPAAPPAFHVLDRVPEPMIPPILVPPVVTDVDGAAVSCWR